MLAMAAIRREINDHYRCIFFQVGRRYVNAIGSEYMVRRHACLRFAYWGILRIAAAKGSYQAKEKAYFFHHIHL